MRQSLLLVCALASPLAAQQFVAELDAGPNGISLAGKGVGFESTLFFPARTAATGYELWRTDGTVQGTQLVQDFAPGPADGVNEVAYGNGKVWVVSGTAIWRIDGPTSAPVFVVQPDPSALALRGLVAKDGWLVFRTETAQLRTFWRSDGTASGTVALHTVGLTQLASLDPTGSIRQVGDLTYFVAQGINSFGTQLVRCNATTGSVVEVCPCTGAWFDLLGDRVHLVDFSIALGGFRFFSVAHDSTTRQLVGQAANIPAVSFSTGTRLVTVTGLGDVMGLDSASSVYVPTPSTSWLPTSLDDFCVGEGFVYKLVGFGSGPRTLWRSDGTVAGTGQVVAFSGTATSGIHRVQTLGAGNRLFLDADDGVVSREPWISRGTQATTALMADLVPGGASAPQLLGVAGERAYFVAFDPVRGRELWSFDLATVGAASAEPFGVGCVGTNGVPILAVDGIPAVGRVLSLRLQRGAPNALAMWFVGLGPQHLSVGGGCEFLMTSVVWSDWAIASAAGAAATSLAVPNDPALVGLPVVAQGSFLDPLGVSSFGTTVTEGVLLVVGG